jgi:hypothetical protein
MLSASERFLSPLKSNEVPVVELGDNGWRNDETVE